MSFPIYRHDLPWDDSRDARARRGSKKHVESLSNDRPSIWKRELSLGRKKDAPADVVVQAAEPVETPPVEGAPSERTSIWKRELSFGRKKPKNDPTDELDTWLTQEDDQPEHEAVAPEPVAEVEQEEIAPVALPELVAEQPADGWHASGWQPVEAPAPEPAPEPAAAGPTYDFPSPAEPEPTFDVVEPEPVFEPEPAFADVDPEPEPTFLEIEPELEHEIEEAPAPAARRTSIWKRELGKKNEKKAKKAKKKKGSDWEFGADNDTTAASETVEAPTVEVEPVATDVESPVDDQPDAGKKRRSRNKKEKQPREKGSNGARGAKKIVGLRIGASQIAAAHVQSNGHHELLKMARTPLDRGVVVAGELRDPDALADALRVFFKQHKLPKQGIRLGIASNRVGVRVLEVSGVEDLSLLGNAVQFRAQEVLPIPLSEAVLDYRVVRERTEEDGTITREVLVAFAYRELVDRYTSVCRAAGLRLIGIDLDGFALLRALVDPADPGERLNGAAVVTVSLGHDRSIMSVTDGTLCEFTRVIEWGGASLDTAVARILALTPSQAEPIKRELTLDRYAETPHGLSDDQATRARTAMVQEVHTFAREFVSSLQFYQAQPGSLDIGEIVVTGGTAHMPGLVEQLQELIGVAVRIGDPLGRVKVSKGVQTDDPVGSLALAIGLGIED